MRLLSIVLFAALVGLAIFNWTKRRDEPFVLLQPPPGEPVSTELSRYWTVPEFMLTERSGELVEGLHAL